MPKEERRIDVMVSSTTSDLGDHRRRLGQIITNLLLTPRLMDNEAPGKEALSFSLDLVDEAEIYILLLGFRYGHVPDDSVRNPYNLSMTHLEYRRAKQPQKTDGICVVPFLVDDALKPEVVRPELIAFRAEVRRDMVKYFNTKDELALLVQQALAQSPCVLNPVPSAMTVHLSRAWAKFWPTVTRSGRNSDRAATAKSGGRKIGSPTAAHWISLCNRHWSRARSAKPMKSIQLVYGLHYLRFAVATASLHIWILYALYGFYYAAVEGTAKALVADLIPEEQRGTAYGCYNAIIGLVALPAACRPKFCGRVWAPRQALVPVHHFWWVRCWRSSHRDCWR